jgi:hypothetical protein
VSTEGASAPGDDGFDSSMRSHRLRIDEINLVGGSRVVLFKPGFNIIVGDITTGKTTLVRLIRALLGTMPSSLPPEVNYVSAIRGEVLLGDSTWKIYRPRTTTSNAMVEVSEEYPQFASREPLSLRLPASAPRGSYSQFLLDRLSIPSVSVPQARSEPGGTLIPVSMTDWLGYCIVTGDELDTQVFGHQLPWRDAKRRWVFELAYGYYDPELAMLNSELRTIDLQIGSLEHEAAVREKFLANTPFRDLHTLDLQIEAAEQERTRVWQRRDSIAREARKVVGVAKVQDSLLSARERRASVEESRVHLQGQIGDLNDLKRQLSTQSARLTRAIVAEEWLVDFDFVVCPRCGSSVDSSRGDDEHCYLCLQEPMPTPSTDQMLGEQERIITQIQETSDVIDLRVKALDNLDGEAESLDSTIAKLTEALARQTDAFVSARAEEIEQCAYEDARLQARIEHYQEYRDLIQRHSQQLEGRDLLEERREEVTSRIQGRELGRFDAEANVRALEERILVYLREMHIPDLGLDLSVKINRRTYLPEISGRTFDELSSQGLKTLVNVAHALAHHTVAIDRNLPIPGLLVLDGLSSNAGHEGFDRDRVDDVYRLLQQVAAEYSESLQIIAVDNPLPSSLLLQVQEYLVLNLTQSDRLIRIPSS